jgi:hypothetical protein
MIRLAVAAVSIAFLTAVALAMIYLAYADYGVEADSSVGNDSTLAD